VESNVTLFAFSHLGCMGLLVLFFNNRNKKLFLAIVKAKAEMNNELLAFT